MRVIGYPQLVAISRDTLQAEPGMLDAEWKARIKDRARILGFDYPIPDMLTRAMNAAQASYEKAHGRRPMSSLNSSTPVLRPVASLPNSGARSGGGPVALKDLAASFRLVK